MRKLMVTTHLTLDGVTQAPGGPGEDDEGGFAFGGWIANHSDELMNQTLGALMGKPFQYLLWLFPLVLGPGKRLFAQGTAPTALKLVDSRVSTTGVVIGTCEPAGDVVTGSVA
jgi:hypothetical protein